jgi:hypothetical protein
MILLKNNGVHGKNTSGRGKKIQPAQPTGPVEDSVLSQSRLKSAEMGLT